MSISSSIRAVRRKESTEEGFRPPRSIEAFILRKTSSNSRQLWIEPCLPPRHPKQYAERMKTATVEFHNLRQHHPGIESAIGALQLGNGLKRCRDHSEIGFERYLGLAILGRNIHVLGKLLIARRNEQVAAALSKRQVA